MVGALLSRGLVAERIVETTTKADAALNRIWRNEPDGRAVLLEITDAGFAAIGAERGESEGGAPEEGDAPAEPAGESRSAPLGAISGGTGLDESEAGEAAHEAAVAPRARKTREGTKQATLIGMLRSEGGATIAEIAAATGWQSHTVRGALSGALKKKLGLEVTSEKDEGRGRVYRLPPD